MVLTRGQVFFFFFYYSTKSTESNTFCNLSSSSSFSTQQNQQKAKLSATYTVKGAPAHPFISPNATWSSKTVFIQNIIYDV